MSKYCLVVFSNATAGREDEYNDWYTNQHIPDTFKVPGFVAAQRFKVHSDNDADAKNETGHKYLTLYEIDTDQRDKTLSELQRRRGTPEMPVSDAIDSAGVSSTWYEAVTPRIVRET